MKNYVNYFTNKEQKNIDDSNFSGEDLIAQINSSNLEMVKKTLNDNPNLSTYSMNTSIQYGSNNETSRTIVDYCLLKRKREIADYILDRYTPERSFFTSQFLLFSESPDSILLTQENFNTISLLSPNHETNFTDLRFVFNSDTTSNSSDNLYETFIDAHALILAVRNPFFYKTIIKPQLLNHGLDYFNEELFSNQRQ